MRSISSISIYVIWFSLLLIFTSCKKDNSVSPDNNSNNNNNNNNNNNDTLVIKRADLLNAKYLFLKKSTGKTLAEYGILFKVNEQNQVLPVQFFNQLNQSIDSVKVKSCVKLDDNYLVLGILENNNVVKKYLLEISSGNLYLGSDVLPSDENVIVQKDQLGNYYYASEYGPQGQYYGYRNYVLIKLSLQNFSASIVNMQGDILQEMNHFMVNKFGDVLYANRSSIFRYRNSLVGNFITFPRGSFGIDKNQDTIYFVSENLGNPVGSQLLKIHPNRTDSQIDTINITPYTTINHLATNIYSDNGKIGFAFPVSNGFTYYEFNTFNGNVLTQNTLNMNDIIDWKTNHDGKFYVLQGGLNPPYSFSLVNPKDSTINTFYTTNHFIINNFKITNDGNIIATVQDINDGLQKLILVKLTGEEIIIEQGHFEIEYLVKI